MKILDTISAAFRSKSAPHSAKIAVLIKQAEGEAESTAGGVTIKGALAAAEGIGAQAAASTLAPIPAALALRCLDLWPNVGSSSCARLSPRAGLQRLLP
jgi:hypothetical protein